MVEITAGLNKEIPVNLTEGTHIIVADLGTTEFAGKVEAHVGTEVSQLVKSESRSTEKGSNIYYGYVNIAAETQSITLYAIDADFKATIKFEDWVVPSLKADGVAVEIPINANGAENPLKINIDKTVQNASYNVKLFADHLINHTLAFYVNSGTLQSFSGSYYSSTGTGTSGQKSINFDVTGEGDTLYIVHRSTSDKFIYPALISISD